MRALLLLLTACWGTSQPPSPQAPPAPAEPSAPSSAFRPRPSTHVCRRTIDNMAEKLRPEFSKTGIPEATIDELIDAAIESCLAMDWSHDLVACYDNAADATDLNACQSLMTTEQSEDVTRRMMDVISRMSQTPPPPPPSP